VEKANDTIASMALPNLKASNLPKEYYSWAQQYSLYIYNRTIKEGQRASPYENRRERVRLLGFGDMTMIPRKQMDGCSGRRNRRNTLF
jgi:hypothetical protein